MSTFRRNRWGIRGGYCCPISPGGANVLAKAAEYGDGVAHEDPSTPAVVDRLKELENRGYAFEGAEASFQLMAKKVRGDYRPFFILHGYTVMIDKRDTDREPRCEANIRVEVGGRFEHTVSAGDGPVNALDRALGKALARFYPTLAEMVLMDYKVRVLSGPETGTASLIRVQVEVTDGSQTWSTVGASTNIIDASYEALIDAIEYKLVLDQVDRAHGDGGIGAGGVRAKPRKVHRFSLCFIAKGHPPPSFQSDPMVLRSNQNRGPVVGLRRYCFGLASH